MTPRGQQASGGGASRPSSNDDGVHGSWQRHDATVYREPMGCAMDAACVAAETTSTARSMMTAMNRTAIVALTVAIVGLAAGDSHNKAAFKRTVLQQADISAPGHEVVTAAVEFQPGGSPGRHTHPGRRSRLRHRRHGSLEREGKPNKTVRAGEAF